MFLCVNLELFSPSFVPLLAPNPGDATGLMYYNRFTSWDNSISVITHYYSHTEGKVVLIKKLIQIRKQNSRLDRHRSFLMVHLSIK